MFAKQFTRSIQFVVASAGLATLMSTTAYAGSAFERGPAPTAESLSSSGPYEIASHVISRAQANGYGGATVHYPASTTQTFGIVSITPGFLAKQGYYKPLSKFIASHGFVVINLDPNSIYDVPSMRARQMAAAIKQVVNMAKAGEAPFASVTDVTRRAVSGHSMGGGGTLSAAQADPTLKAAVPLAPWHSTKNFSRVEVPTLIVSCEKDTIATNKQHSNVFYASLAADLPRGKVEIKGADHMCSTTLAPNYVTTVGKATVAWLKRFLDEDTRYDAMLDGGMNAGDFSQYDVEGL